LSKEKEVQKENLGKYFLYGVVVALLLLVFYMIFYKGDNLIQENQLTQVKEIIWSAESDSAFINSCFEKYRLQAKDDVSKQGNAKIFCRCMLEKIKTKYSEIDIVRMTDADIKKWDKECRDEIGNPGSIKK